ncbi:SpvB/TcaC N-terminal domain-containing protein [Serratia sp. AKBS12]|uniref:SpvB/TcaC N-terminal domain-containing protein n=1 Tax=Serratia sp. AKBS12 TaxID=2974597 RepID=UPI0021653A57|nr:SpvB/TcaC N-terminal domain-containing protein [Serratia sp. AKBS12]MCS3409313.1 hypothetical protein [Serratia sp. AKBS12]
MQDSEKQPLLNPPSLPKGGGALTGLSGTPGGAVSDGSATFSLPLPIFPGRGYAPELDLSYSSLSGNGEFGMGWSSSTMSVRRNIKKRVPTYSEQDEYLSPEGEILVVLPGAPITKRHSLLGVDLGEEYHVVTYRNRVECSFSRLEFWQPVKPETLDFWVMYSADGQVHLMGNTAEARLTDPQDSKRTAQWLLTASVSLTGEQMYYQYRAEDDIGCINSEQQAHPDATAQRYLLAVHYGNLIAGRTLPGLDGTDPLKSGWLFSLVFDYGERSVEKSALPQWQSDGQWLCRQDCFSRYEYGFEVRTRRLCRQVLMFQRIKTLEGTAEGEDTPQLITRLLLTYNETPSISLLASACQMAWEKKGNEPPLSLPPLDIAWQSFDPPKPHSAVWELRDDLHNLSHQHPYQFIDLKGEGISGILYNDGKGWWYRAPIRNEKKADQNAVTWDCPEKLPMTPSLQVDATLADLDGKGKLQWVVTAQGIAGSYSQTERGEWLRFTPLSALPVEYTHPRAHLADLMGGGFSDLVMIGPRSVRLYARQNETWTKGGTVIQSEGISLPIPGADPAALVAFSDPLGSGQQHLVQIRAEGVTCWPNLGGGRFGHPLTLPGFSQPSANFNPQRVFLADIDGSGTADLIYAHSDSFSVYLNQSGNRFAVPFSLPLPQGVRFDNTCELQIADVQGLGVASLLLNCPHPTPRHWVCSLSSEKPWLLNGMNNNMGADHRLYYRSSAQFWLDEKTEAKTANKAPPPCYLPMALHTLWRTETTDEITGNRLSSEIRYKTGVWDGREREFRGFGYVEVRDTDITASRGTAIESSLPSKRCSWYATGLPAVDEQLHKQYWRGDTAAFAAFSPRFTIGSAEEERVYSPDENISFWLNRGLKGMQLRSELYGLDGSAMESLPYSVTEMRPQIRLIDIQTYPVILPSVVESRTYHYERIITDPQCSQEIQLSTDEYGQPLRQLSIAYPRRPRPSSALIDSDNTITLPAEKAIPDTLIAGTKASATVHLYISDDPSVRSCVWSVQGNNDFWLQKAESTGDNAWQTLVEGTEARALAPKGVIGRADYRLKKIFQDGQEAITDFSINVISPVVTVTGFQHVSQGTVSTLKAKANFLPETYQWTLLKEGEEVVSSQSSEFHVDTSALDIGLYRVNLKVEDWSRDAQVSTALTITQSACYPDGLPETLLASSYDEQQQTLYLTLQQSSWHNIDNSVNEMWLLGVADARRSDIFSHPASAVPSGGLTLEHLQQDGGLIAADQPCTLAMQQQIWYLDSANEPTLDLPAMPPRVAFTEQAEFDEETLAAFENEITADHLILAGYYQSTYLFPRKNETGKKLWTVRSGFATYAGAAHFWLPISFRESEMTGALTVTRDRYDCVITKTQDAAGLTTLSEYDWRFLVPVRLIDANDNVHVVTLDALGRVITSRFRGTEEGIATGYSTDAMMVPADADTALGLTSPLPVAQCIVYIADSWMAGNTENGGRIPPHVLTLTTDRYDSDNAQQIRQQVVFSDGFGRVLQTAVRYEAGKAWSRTGSGGLQTGADDLPVEVETAFRWVVSGRTEYDNKGQAVRTYQPYFLDSWKYVSDDSARRDLYADTHYYDPTGREWQVRTAKGWWRRTLFTPWFVVSEDENDTVAGVSGVAAPDHTGGPE